MADQVSHREEHIEECGEQHPDSHEVLQVDFGTQVADGGHADGVREKVERVDEAELRTSYAELGFHFLFRVRPALAQTVQSRVGEERQVEDDELLEF